MPQQRTFIRTSPAAGSGIGTSASRSGEDSIGAICSRSMAFMGIAQLLTSYALPLSSARAASHPLTIRTDSADGFGPLKTRTPEW